MLQLQDMGILRVDGGKYLNTISEVSEHPVLSVLVMSYSVEGPIVWERLCPKWVKQGQLPCWWGTS